MSLRTKLQTGSSRSRPCVACGLPVSVSWPWLAGSICAPAIFGIAANHSHLSSIWSDFAALGAGVLVSLALVIYVVPVVKRDA